MKFVNLGTVAHVDAGKTSLTERLLYDSGVLARMGRATTQNGPTVLVS